MFRANIEWREEFRGHVENPIPSWQTRFMEPDLSSASFRIASDPKISRGKAIQLTIDEQIVTAHEGESVASIMMVEGKVAMRTTTEGDPRGIFCGMGVCFDCLVVVDDVPNIRACMTWAQEGMRVNTQRGLSK